MLASFLPIYDRWLVPATREDVQGMIATLSLAYPAARLSEELMLARLDLYAASLADVPKDVLMFACQSAINELKFFPSVAELRDQCGMAAKRAWRRWRCQQLIELHDREWRLSEEDRCTADSFAEARRAAGLVDADDYNQNGNPKWLREAMARQAKERGNA